jgi:hypothetical protein
MTSTLEVVCCVCGAHKGEKEGHGATVITSTICTPCALTLLPADLHAEYLRRRELEGL